MVIARRLVIFFMVLAMIWWSVLLWTAGMVLGFGELVIERQPNLVLPLQLMKYGWITYLLAYIWALLSVWLRMRMLHLLILAFGVISWGLYFSAGLLAGGMNLMGAAMQICFTLGPPMIVAGGFTFLRMTRHHPALAKELPKEEGNAS